MIDCDFYYFNPSGKWKYHGEGRFPSHELLGIPLGKYYYITHDTISQANDNKMPGINSDGKYMMVIIIPRNNCQATYAFPHMIKAERESR